MPSEITREATRADVGLPLHKAAREGESDVLSALLLTNQFDVNCGSFDLMRPLHEASLNGHIQCVRLLLDFGAQVNVCNIDGATPLCDASCKGNVDVVTLLLDHGALVNPPLTMHTPLHEAVLHNKWECVEVLLAHKANPNVSDCHYGTPLHVAANMGHVKCAEALLRHSANVNATHIHSTPLHVSALKEDEALIWLLLEYGADVYKENCKGLTARDMIGGHDSNKTSDLRNLLLFWERNPKSLSHYCRLSVQKTMGSRGLHLLESAHLSVPQAVKDFLLHKPQKRFSLEELLRL